jgi:hypothetical protein
MFDVLNLLNKNWDFKKWSIFFVCQLEKCKASLSLRDQEIQLLRQFDEDHVSNYNNNIDGFIKSEK